MGHKFTNLNWLWAWQVVHSSVACTHLLHKEKRITTYSKEVADLTDIVLVAMTADETPCNLATTFFLIPRSHCQVVNCSLLWVQGIVVGLKRLTITANSFASNHAVTKTIIWLRNWYILKWWTCEFVLRYICPRKLNNSLRTQVKEVKSRKHEKVVAYGKNQENKLKLNWWTWLHKAIT